MKTSAKSKQRKKQKVSWKVLLILIAIPFTVLLTQFQQNIRSSAQMVLQTPPIFFCLAMGQSDRGQCASSTIQADSQLDINGAPLTRNKTVYYNDTVSGTATYTNTGDVPITIKKLALTAESEKGKKRVQFNPDRRNVTLAPGQTITIASSSRFFESPDPGGVWQVFSAVTLADGQVFDSFKKTTISVSTACTGLRAIPLTDSDIATVKNLCSQNPKSKLCTSRQYCELTGGEDCQQAAVQQQHLDKQLQCDANIIIPEEEQHLLEELCKANPDTDTCKNFCDRTIGSSVCPDPNIVAQGVTVLVAGAKIAKANASCRSGVSNYIGECCASTATYMSAAGNELCGSAPGGGGSAPAPAPVKNAPQCNSGIANKVGECCAVGTCVVNGLCSRSCGGSGGGETGGGSGGAPAQPSCSSGTKNSIGQCCKYSGALTSGGRCPTSAGGGSTPPSRFEVSKGVTRRTCAANTVLRNGKCVRVDGSTPGTGVPSACKGAGASCGSGQCCSPLVCNLTSPSYGTCGTNRGLPPVVRACVSLGNTCSSSSPCCAGNGTCQQDIDGMRCLKR